MTPEAPTEPAPYEPPPYEPSESPPATAEGGNLNHWLETFADLSRSRPASPSTEPEPAMAPSDDIGAFPGEVDTDESASRPADSPPTNAGPMAPLPTDPLPTTAGPEPAPDNPLPIESTQPEEQFAPVDDTLLPRDRRRRR